MLPASFCDILHRQLNELISMSKKRAAVKSPSNGSATLFIDARKLGTLIDRVHHELTDADIARIADTSHAWLGDRGTGVPPVINPSHQPSLEPGESNQGRVAAATYADIAGFSKSADIAEHGYVLTPCRSVGAEEVEGDAEPFAEKMQRLVSELNSQFAETAKLEAAVRRNLAGLGFLAKE